MMTSRLNRQQYPASRRSQRASLDGCTLFALSLNAAPHPIVRFSAGYRSLRSDCTPKSSNAAET
jgi:hypothetical protein